MLFWRAAAEGELLLQRCIECQTYQFYPRPFCIKCQSDAVEWVRAAGTGTVYSKTTVLMRVIEELEPPFTVGLIELTEGPRILANLASGAIRIGDSVVLGWRARQGLPPFPIFDTQRNQGHAASAGHSRVPR